MLVDQEMVAFQDNRTFSYMLDKQDRIHSFNQSWKDFAFENDTEIMADGWLIGQLVWDFIADVETRYLYHLLFDKARELSTPIRISYRCDSSRYRRFMQMRIECVQDYHLKLDSRIIQLQEREPITLLDMSQARGKEMITMCGWCKLVNMSLNEWVEVEEAIEDMGIFKLPKLPRISHGICPTCHEAVLHEWKTLRPDQI